MTSGASRIGVSDSEFAALAPIREMLSTLEPLALAELERALRLTLNPPQTAAQRRVIELGFLARLFEEHPADLRPRIIPRSLYDERRLSESPASPESRRLVDRYGSWQRVCRAAASIRPDGRISGKHLAYSNPTRGRRRVAPYTREETQKAICRCAFELGRIPSSGVYQRWVLDANRAARKAGIALPRLPGSNAAYRFYKHWKCAVAAAAITEADVTRGRVERVLRLARIDALPPAPLEAFKEADASALAQIGIDPARREHLAIYGLAQMWLSEAVRVCQLLSGSLDWLAGRDSEPGTPPSEQLVFDASSIETLLQQKDIDVTELRRRLELPVGSWRRLRNGKREPLLYELAVLGAAGKTRIEDLLSSDSG